MYEIVVMGAPRGKERPRFTKNGRTYTPKKTTEYEKEIATAWREKYGDEMVYGHLRLAVFAYFAPNKSDTKKVVEQKLRNFLLPTKKPDADNILKVVADALNMVAYVDDARITTMYCTKRYAEHGYIKIQISEEDT